MISTEKKNKKNWKQVILKKVIHFDSFFTFLVNKCQEIILWVIITTYETVFNSSFWFWYWNINDKNRWSENIVNKCEIQPVSEIQPMLTSLRPFVNPMLITTVTSAVTHFRSSHRKCSVKNMFLEISQHSQESICARVPFLIKLQGWGLQLYQKRDSGTGIFLWMLRNF